MSTLGDRIKLLRKEALLTQDELGKKLNIGKSTISQYENNINTPDIDTIKRIADIFDVSLDYLLCKSDIRKNNNWEPTLNKKDEKNIEKQLDKILNGLESDNGLMLNGEVLDDITRELLYKSIKNGLEYAKLASKKKFTPKKYRINESNEESK